MTPRDAMQNFLREVAKPDGGLCTYGDSTVSGALADGNVDYIITTRPSIAAGYAQILTVHLLEPGTDEYAVLDKAFGGVAAILLKRGDD